MSAATVVLAQQVVKFSPKVILDNLDLLWDGVQLTVLVSVISFGIATFLGVFVALARMSERRAVATFAAGTGVMSLLLKSLAE